MSSFSDITFVNLCKIAFFPGSLGDIPFIARFDVDPELTERLARVLKEREIFVTYLGAFGITLVANYYAESSLSLFATRAIGFVACCLGMDSLNRLFKQSTLICSLIIQQEQDRRLNRLNQLANYHYA